MCSEFETTLLLEFVTEDSSRMSRHILMKWIEKKNKKMTASRVYDEFDQMFIASLLRIKHFLKKTRPCIS